MAVRSNKAIKTEINEDGKKNKNGNGGSAMKIVLLSGGSGKRLWPLSNDARSKQFLKVLQDENGNSESMIQRVYRQIRQSQPDAQVFVVSSQAQTDPICRQLGEKVIQITEPTRRHTYPAILLAGAWLLEKEQIPETETIIVLPVDPYVEQEYFDKLAVMERALEESGAEICLLGVKPTYPSEKYGYITGKRKKEQFYHQVASCVEKPRLEQAKKLLSEGAMWNGGVFAFRASYIKRLLMKESGTISYETLRAAYEQLPVNSFDYEVIEKNPYMVYVDYIGEWNDIGTWNTMTEKMQEPDGGYVVRGENCQNTHVINELEIPIVALGLKDAVVVASADGILVSDKKASSYMQPYVEQIESRPMYEKRQWGEYKVLDITQFPSKQEKSLTKRIHVEPGKGLSCQLHHHRAEVWTVTDGEGMFLLDDTVRKVTRGDVLYIEKEQKHAMGSKYGVSFVEVQLGTDLVEEDIERFPWDWTPYLR